MKWCTPKIAAFSTQGHGEAKAKFESRQVSEIEKNAESAGHNNHRIHVSRPPHHCGVQFFRLSQGDDGDDDWNICWDFERNDWGDVGAPRPVRLTGLPAPMQVLSPVAERMHLIRRISQQSSSAAPQGPKKPKKRKDLQGRASNTKEDMAKASQKLQRATEELDSYADRFREAKDKVSDIKEPTNRQHRCNIWALDPEPIPTTDP
eukprot:Skav214098  [mRNA]  locus=scaffold1185:160876:175297:- [translate_table: standard]